MIATSYVRDTEFEDVVSDIDGRIEAVEWALTLEKWAKNIRLDDPKTTNIILICLALVSLRCTDGKR